MSEFLGFIGTCLDITELHEARELIAKQHDELAFILKHDHLPQAYTRRHLFEQAQTEIKRSQRHKHELPLLFMDIDKYKGVNDTYGHKVGDEILVSLVKCLKKNVRDIDIVCRYAGDEFCIILPATLQADAIEIAERILANARKIKIRNAPNLHITLSIGLAKYITIMNTVEDWIHHADQALYEAKRTGRNKVCVAQVEAGLISPNTIFNSIN